MGQSCARFCPCCCPDEGEVTPLLKSKKLIRSQSEEEKSRDLESVRAASSRCCEKGNVVYHITGEGADDLNSQTFSKSSQNIDLDDEEDVSLKPVEASVSDVTESGKQPEKKQESQEEVGVKSPEDAAEAPQPEVEEAKTTSPPSEEKLPVPTESEHEIEKPKGEEPEEPYKTPESSSDDNNAQLTADEDLSDSLAAVPPVESSDVNTSGEQEFREK